MFLDQHLKENNVGYFKHLIRAVILSAMAFTAGIIFLFHAILPFVFTQTGSNLIKKIQSRFYQ
jgi:hypothetical protein